jgi:hypothetical protein
LNKMIHKFQAISLIVLRVILILTIVMFVVGALQPVGISQAQTGGHKYYFPLILNTQIVYQSGPSIYTTSYYMKSTDATPSYKLGCELGTRDFNLEGYQDNFVILDYGQPIYDLMNGQYAFGTYDFAHAYVDLTQIASSVENFANGYYICTGNDYSSKVKIGIGTSNYGKTTCTECWVNASHGQAWGTMVNTVNDWIVSQKMSGQVSAAGANDIELSWNTYSRTNDWVTGYFSSSKYALYNYGAVEGCPSQAHPTWNCNNGWSLDNVWSIIWGGGAIYPVPEIYANDGINADQWYWMSVYAYTQHGLAVGFAGVLTQRQSCGSATGYECSVLGNTPQQGYSQLQDLLNGDLRTVFPIRWSSDMKYQ